MNKLKGILVIIGIPLCVFSWWVIKPLFTEVVVSEPLISSAIATSTEIKLLQAGTFKGFDRIHNGTGTVSVYRRGTELVLRFEEDFSVNNGPDLFVGFGKNNQYIEGSEISKLKGTVGSQNYTLPADFFDKGYDSVYVWCKAFSTPFIQATLTERAQQ
jgi:hypothetical protein